MEERFRYEDRPDLIPAVSAVVPIMDYKLLLTFKSGEIRIYDCGWMLKEKLFQPLRDYEFFVKAHVSDDTVAWNSMIDMGPDDLYENSVPVLDNEVPIMMAV